jgi:hypothetical protein
VHGFTIKRHVRTKKGFFGVGDTWMRKEGDEEQEARGKEENGEGGARNEARKKTGEGAGGEVREEREGEGEGGETREGRR